MPLEIYISQEKIYRFHKDMQFICCLLDALWKLDHFHANITTIQTTIFESANKQWNAALWYKKLKSDPLTISQLLVTQHDINMSVYRQQQAISISTAIFEKKNTSVRIVSAVRASHRPPVFMISCCNYKITDNTIFKLFTWAWKAPWRHLGGAYQAEISCIA